MSSFIFPGEANTRRGSELSLEDRKYVLAAFVHRHTKTHKPAWARQPWKDGKPYPALHADDADWLANTWFKVLASGRIDRRASACHSNPTYPDNPELRREAAKTGDAA